MDQEIRRAVDRMMGTSGQVMRVSGEEDRYGLLYPGPGTGPGANFDPYEREWCHSDGNWYKLKFAPCLKLDDTLGTIVHWEKMGRWH
jgi:hypothetical protein